MPPPSAGSQQQSGDNSLAPLWIIISFFVLGWLLWSFFHTQIVTFCLLIKFWEARCIALFLPHVAYLPIQIKHLAPFKVDFSQLIDISQNIGSYLRYPISIVLAVLASVIYFRHITLRFKKVYSMRSLSKAERQSWPQITPVIKLDLVKEDINKGAWAMGLSPMQFAKKHQLLKEEKTILIMTSSAPRKQTSVQVRRDVAYHVFILQLGEQWRGIEYLPPATKALMAIFAARANHDRDGALKFLLQIAESTKTGRLDFSGIEGLWEKHKNTKAVNKVIHSHAYVLTVMASMLDLARKDGVLASADFLWLKPTDRTLWFMLNSVGRQTVFSEVAGPFAHWNAERSMGRRLLAPMIDEAVNGLEAAIKNILYIPDSD